MSEKEKLLKAYHDYRFDASTNLQSSSFCLFRELVQFLCQESIENDQEEWLIADNFFNVVNK